MQIQVSMKYKVMNNIVHNTTQKTQSDQCPDA